MTDLSDHGSSSGRVPCDARTAAYIVAAYLLAHGLTTWIVSPVQEQIIPHATMFACILYLPHGVRVLTAWLCGWRAVVPLLVASVLADLIFTPPETREILRPVVVQSWLVGALCAPIAFDLVRRIAGRSIGGRSKLTDWRYLLVVGIVASVLNSVGQSYVFSGFMSAEELAVVVALYAIGDILGLVVSVLVLMSVFRWMRLGRFG